MICCSASGVGRVFGIRKDSRNNDYIIVEIERPFFDSQKKVKFDYIPLFDWNDSSRRLTKYYDVGDIVAFKGRVETREEIGIIIVCEQISLILKEKNSNSI